MQLNKTLIFLAAFFSAAAFAGAAQAVCPVCVVAVGAGVGLCRWLGIDDTISGLWIGGLLASLSMWTYFWLKNKNWAFKFSKIVVPAAYYLIVVAPLYYFDIMGHPLNKFLGIDKLLLGIISGTIVFLLGYKIDIFLKQRNQGKVLFYYQKVVFPVSFLIIASAIFYFVIKCY